MKELRLPLAAAAAGVAVLLSLFHLTDPTALFPVAIDRAQAIVRAQRLTEKYGVRTQGWRIDATNVTDEKMRAYREAFPGDAAARLFTPLGWGVLFTAPDRRQVRVQLSAEGKPRQWEFLRHGAAAPLAAPTLEAETVLADFAGTSGSQFRAVEVPAQSGIRHQFWEWPAGPRFPLVAQFDIARLEGEEYTVTLDQRYERGYQRPADAAPGRTLRLSWGFYALVGFLVALFWSIAGWVRGSFTWRGPAGLAAALILWTGLMALAGPGLQDMRYGQSGKVVVQTVGEAQAKGANIAIQTAPSASFFGSTVGPFALLFVFGGASYAVARGRFRRKWESLELLLRGRLLTRQVARPIALGALWGTAAAALPYIAAWLFRGAGLTFRSAGVLSAPVAGVLLLQPGVTIPAFGFLGFAYPLAAQFQRRLTRLAALAVVAAGFLLYWAPAFDSVAAGLGAGAASAVAWFLIYEKVDLLAAVSGMLATRALLEPATLLAQPVASLRTSGVYMVVLLVAGTAVFVYHAVRGRDAFAGVDAAGMPVSDLGEGGPLRARSSRERLEAEFQVARQAQQDALPAAAPALEGFSISAACEPAQQVGGDLYDYFPLPDGRLGIAVADVSGKGVPAALYMMVTKGLLAAAAQDSSDLAFILRGINAHLYRACKRKVFVTMAALAVEPAGRVVEYARAGHNPIVWRRTRRGETLLVKPSGMGLGMCSSEQFGRSLRLERMELEPGDAVVLYSDGITEAVNATLDQFGEDRLIRSVEQTDGRPADEMRTAILSDLAAFTGSTPAWDDVTLVALRVDDIPRRNNG